MTHLQMLEKYNVVWENPSQNSAESMPCGGGDIGLNVWVEEGDILFYVARSGTFDENNAMPKLGRIRIRCSPNPFDGDDFRQELNLEKGSISLRGQNGEHWATVHIWVDVFCPMIHVEVESNQPLTIDADYESWRFEDKLVQPNESFANSYKWAPPDGLTTKQDAISFEDNSVLFYHRNSGLTVFDVTVQQQQMDAVKAQMFDPLKNLTFGGKFWGENFIPAGNTAGKYLSTDYRGWRIQSQLSAQKHLLHLALHTGQYEEQSDWASSLNRLIADYADKRSTARSETESWWQAYWARSFVHIGPGSTVSKTADAETADAETADAESPSVESPSVESPQWQVGRNYQLFRYMLGCNAFGSYPTKFNGGLFTYDPEFVDPERAFSADFRNWGGGTFTAQNQRLVYFPMFASGDFDLLKPQLDFYLRTLKNAELRSQVYWGHEGACFTEQIDNFGLPNCTEYSWERPDGYDPGIMYNAWLEYQWDTSLEFCLMALQLHQYTNADITNYIPLIEGCLTFFDEHYQQRAKARGIKTLDENGHLILYPGSACETYKMAYNATSTIAGLMTVTEGLLDLPEHYLTAAQREKWQGFLKRIPPISFQEFDGHKTIAPAQVWERVNNTEAPQLYPVYPWGQYGINKPDLDVAINTYKYDPDVQKFMDHISWKQYNIFAARLGLTEEAERLSILKLQDSDRRFPAYWGPGFDWVPDHNWGGSGMIGIQEMLLQSDGDAIYLFPAWPQEWDVHFKLHAPQNTWVEAELKNGKVNIIQVSPESRRGDITITL